MGILVGTIQWKSSLNADRDGADLCLLVKNTLATPSPGLTVIFLAETHRNPFDTRRAKLVYDEFSKGTYRDSLSLVVERGLFPGCSSLAQVVYEGVTEYTSGDQLRNSRMISLLEDRLSEVRSGVVVVFFGEAHLDPLKRELVGARPLDRRIRWVEAKSFTTTFASLPLRQPTGLDTSAMEPAGYVAAPADDILSDYAALLCKGYVSEGVTLPLLREDQLRLFSRGGTSVFAVYFVNSTYHQQIRSWVEEDGATDVILSAREPAVAVRVSI